MANGSVGAPAINFASSPNTGIFSPFPGRIALATGGKPFLRGGDSNTALGLEALAPNTGSLNTALGGSALRQNTTGFHNTALGHDALFKNTSGSQNTALGVGALQNNTTGSKNIAVGNGAGIFPTASSDSIFIGNGGQPADTATIRIGQQSRQTSAFIAGIRGRTTGRSDAIAVLIDSLGQLGTVSSSRRYKEDIEPMGDVSAMLLKLRPVTFRYKKSFDDGTKPIQHGLIAEEVAAVLPGLAVFNDDGEPETVKYHLLPMFLFAGYQQQHKTIQVQHTTIQAQAERIAALERRLQDLEAQLTQPASRSSAAAATHGNNTVRGNTTDVSGTLTAIGGL